MYNIIEVTLLVNEMQENIKRWSLMLRHILREKETEIYKK